MKVDRVKSQQRRVHTFMLSRSVLSDSSPLWAVAHQAPLSMGFSRQEYWSGLPFPFPGNLPNAGIKPSPPALADGFFITEPPGKQTLVHGLNYYYYFCRICINLGLSWWLSDKESSCQYRRCGFNPWVRKMPRRRKWQPTPVFLPGESPGQRSLVGYSPWGCRRVRLRLNN